MNVPLCERSDRILIIGGGCFGLSTAYHLLKEGFTDVTIVERSDKIPALDAASNDMNRIVRSSYADPFYAKFASEAIKAWKTQAWLENAYHESGVLLVGLKGADSGSYSDVAYQNDVSLGSRIESVDGYESISRLFPPGVTIAPLQDGVGYLNHDGGWADARKGTELMAKEVQRLGCKFICGRTAEKILFMDERTTRVCFTDRTAIDCKMAVIATGSWTAASFPELNLKQFCTATGQCLAMIRLTQQEADRYRDCPVFLSFEKDGFYCFPPNEENILKVAIHGPGYVRSVGGISTPRTIVNDLERGLFIPKPALETLRMNLANLYPELASKPILATRLCWYNETEDEDWLIGPLPNHPNVVLATGGSGHAYKFLPVIGSLVSDIIQGKLDPSLAHKFAPDRVIQGHIPSRNEAHREELDSQILCNSEDLYQ